MSAIAGIVADDSRARTDLMSSIPFKVGHADVGDEDMGHLCLQRLEGGRRRSDGAHARRNVRNRRDELVAVRVVLDDEGAHAGELGLTRGWVRGAALVVRLADRVLRRDRHLDGEHRSPTQPLALRPHGPAVLLDEVLHKEVFSAGVTRTSTWSVSPPPPT